MRLEVGLRADDLRVGRPQGVERLPQVYTVPSEVAADHCAGGGQVAPDPGPRRRPRSARAVRAAAFGQAPGEGTAVAAAAR